MKTNFWKAIEKKNDVVYVNDHGCSVSDGLHVSPCGYVCHKCDVFCEEDYCKKCEAKVASEENLCAEEYS